MNIFKKLLSKIRIIFIKKDNLTFRNRKLSKENKSNETQENFEIIEENKINELLTKIEVGDIIWAKRYKTLEEKQDIPEGHREGPHIVVGKTIDGLICSKGTSVLPSEYKSDKFLTIKDEDYNLNKTTHFKLHDLRVIDDTSFIKIQDHLAKEDLEKLMKNIKFKSNHFYYLDGKRKTFDVTISTGDIIKVNNINYIVISEEKEKLTCLRLKTGSIRLTKNDMQYLNYLNLFEFDKNDKPSYLGTISPTLLMYTLKRQKEYIENYANQSITQRGSIISTNNKLRYIYGEEGKNWLTFKIYQYETQYDDKIKIRTKTYYTKYKTSKINKDEQFTTIALAFEEEIDAIKMSKKKYKHRLEELNKNQKSDVRIRKK